MNVHVRFLRTTLGITFRAPSKSLAMFQNLTHTMMKKCKAAPGDGEKQIVDNLESDNPLSSQQEQIRRNHKRLLLLTLAITVLLLAAAVLTYAAYSLATSIPAHTSQGGMVDRVIVPSGVDKRDELGGGQIFGIVAGVFVLLAFVVVSLWVFRCVSGAVEMMGRSGK